LLLRLVKSPTAQLHVQATQACTFSLPEKLDSAMLAQRLREAAASGAGQAVPPEFLSVDWQQQADSGDAAQGRRLFGTLGCVKCHAVTIDGRGAGAPNLSDARRRFTIPHLVESILLPSKLVAEPFRATNLTTDDGQVLSGLVVEENADELELLLADA